MIKLRLLSQKDFFPKDVQSLVKSKSMLKNSNIANHSAFLGPHGFLRSTGRIMHFTVIVFDTKRPIILDSCHPVVLKFLIETHENNHHQGVEYARSFLQQKYAILKLRSTIRSIQRNCVTCRKFRAKPSTPIKSDLPKERLGCRLKPFTFTGVDHFGPLYLAVRRNTQKRRVLLFTCLTTPAIHIEIAHSMDADSCIMGVERFVARRGKPKCNLVRQLNQFCWCRKKTHWTLEVCRSTPNQTQDESKWTTLEVQPSAHSAPRRVLGTIGPKHKTLFL